MASIDNHSDSVMVVIFKGTVPDALKPPSCDPSECWNVARSKREVCVWQPTEYQPPARRLTASECVCVRVCVRVCVCVCVCVCVLAHPL